MGPGEPPFPPLGAPVLLGESAIGDLGAVEGTGAAAKPVVGAVDGAAVGEAVGATSGAEAGEGAEASGAGAGAEADLGALGAGVEADETTLTASF